jgi:ferredoxin
MNDKRRIIIKAGAAAAITGLCPVALSFLTSCAENSVNPIARIAPNKDLCIGCGNCLEFCYYQAIQLPEKSKYFIDTNKCNLCSKCVPKCSQKAINVTSPKYRINEDKCIGCGKCIDVCRYEGNCIIYSKEFYTVKNSCGKAGCHSQCIFVCEPKAFYSGTNHMEIDTGLCSRCGKCIDACPLNAISPAKAAITEDLCSSCGKCLPVCEYDAIEVIHTDNNQAPSIDIILCTSCGDCIKETYCPDFDAIVRELKQIEIDSKRCHECGNCLDVCYYNAIKKVY